MITSYKVCDIVLSHISCVLNYIVQASMYNLKMVIIAVAVQTVLFFFYKLFQTFHLSNHDLKPLIPLQHKDH